MNDGCFSLSLSAAIAHALFQRALVSNAARAEYAGMMYYIDRPKLALELSYRFESEERTGPFISTKNSSHILNERFDIQTEGFVYHPALFVYILRLSPEWQQSLAQHAEGRQTTLGAYQRGWQ